MTFDLIITTYNRPAEVFSLVCQALECNPAPEKVIVVDSSDEVHTNLLGIAGVWYIRSSHKNQPYQRLLGATAATSDIVVFFDDDLKITNNKIFDLILEVYKEDTVIGSTVAIDYQSMISNKIDDPVISTKQKWVVRFWEFTGVPFPSPGKINRLGIVGANPSEKQQVEYFHGPCMSFRRHIIDKIIPYPLLSLYEKKIGKGEDKVISMLANQFGLLIYIPENCLFHEANESSYFQNIRNFTKRITYSRLYLSKSYAKIFQKSLILEIVAFYWFTFWRLMVAFISWAIKPSQARKYKLLGTIDGLYLSLMLPQKAEKLTPNIHWEVEIQKDIKITEHAGRT